MPSDTSPSARGSVPGRSLGDQEGRGSRGDRQVAAGHRGTQREAFRSH